MLADPTGAFTKVELNVWYMNLYVVWLLLVYWSVFVVSAPQEVDLLLDNDQIVQVLGNKRSKR